MILTAHQPVFAPYLGTFAKIAQADIFCVLDTVQFSRKSWENRVWIKTQAGPLLLTVPVESQDHFNKTGGEIRIIQNGWARKMCRSIELAYQKAPFFKDYIGPLEAILMAKHERLADLNRATLDFGLKSLGISVPIETASNYAFRGEKSALILDMAQQLGARKYIFGAMGRSYANPIAFAAVGIEIEFQEFVPKPYAQQFSGFVPNLSFIDALFNLGPNARKIL